MLSTCRHFAGKQPAECKGRNLLLFLAKNLQLIHLTKYRIFGDLRAVVGQEDDNETIVHSVYKLYVADLKDDDETIVHSMCTLYVADLKDDDETRVHSMCKLYVASLKDGNETRVRFMCKLYVADLKKVTRQHATQRENYV